MPVLMIFTDFLSAVVTTDIAKNFSLYGGVGSEVAKLKWFCFDQALKLALYIKKKKKKARYSHNNCQSVSSDRCLVCHFTFLRPRASVRKSGV